MWEVVVWEGEEWGSPADTLRWAQKQPTNTMQHD